MSPNLETLPQRSDLLRRLRAFFDQRGFLEVQPPCLSRDCVVDAYLDPIRIPAGHFGVASVQMPTEFFLQTSPESAMKRMLAAGSPSIYSIGPVFRSGEQGRLHNVEFTMLEWYDVGADINAAVTLLAELARSALAASTCHVISYCDLFGEHLEFDPIDVPLKKLREQVALWDSDLAESLSTDRDAMLDVLLSRAVQPQMGEDPVIVTDYPLSQAALARESATDPRCAARFELFANGIELANGYDELRDVDELIRRYNINNRKRNASGRESLAVETTLVDAMRRGLPPCSGVALGVDRLLMVQLGKDSIRDVIPFPIDQA